MRTGCVREYHVTCRSDHFRRMRRRIGRHQHIGARLVDHQRRLARRYRIDGRPVHDHAEYLLGLRVRDAVRLLGVAQPDSFLRLPGSRALGFKHLAHRRRVVRRPLLHSVKNPTSPTYRDMDRRRPGARNRPVAV